MSPVFSIECPSQTTFSIRPPACCAASISLVFLIRRTYHGRLSSYVPEGNYQRL